MPDQPFDRTIINPREKPLSEDVNTYLAQLDRSLRFFAKSLFATTAGAPTDGFVQAGFKAVESGPQGMSVVLKAGLGFQNLPGDVPTDIDGVIGLDDLEPYKPLPLIADLTVPISAAPAAPNSRIDIIEVRADRLKTDNQSRQVFDNAAKSFSPTAVDKTLEFLLDGTKLGAVADPAPSTAAISLKQGVPGTPGVAPAVTAGYVKVADVFVDGDVIVITDADITDARQKLRADEGVQPKFVPSANCAVVADVNGADSMLHAIGNIASRGAVPMGAFIPVDLPIGSRVLGIQVFVHDSAGAVVRFDLRQVVVPNVASLQISDVVLSSGVSSEEELDMTTISFNGGSNVIADDTSYSIRVLENTVIRPAAIRIYGARILYDRPF